MKLTISISKENYCKASTIQNGKFHTLVEAFSSSDITITECISKVYLESELLFPVVSLDRLNSIQSYALEIYGDDNIQIHIKSI